MGGRPYPWALITQVVDFPLMAPTAARKTAEDLAKGVTDYRSLDRLRQKLDDAEARLTITESHGAYARQLARVELLQRAVELAEARHPWASYGEGYLSPEELQSMGYPTKPRRRGA